MSNKKKVDLSTFFEKCWQESEWISIKEYYEANGKQPVTLKIESWSVFDGNFGSCMQFIFSDSENVQVRMLSNSKAFEKAIKEHCKKGDTISLFKNSKGWWQFELV